MFWGGIFAVVLKQWVEFNLTFKYVQLQPSDCDLASIFREEKHSLLKSVNLKQIHELSQMNHPLYLFLSDCKENLKCRCQYCSLFNSCSLTPFSPICKTPKEYFSFFFYCLYNSFSK